MKFTGLSCFIALSIQLADGRLYESVDSLPNKRYDFIVVGGGTGGSVVASRLSENSRHNVLLIEAGPNNEGILELEVPFLHGVIPSTYNWNYTTEPTLGLNNRSQPIQSGHVLGGSSCINGMIYTRGSADDYDAWARISGDPGWRWDRLFPLIKRHERFLQPLGGRNTTGQFDPRAHGFNGKTEVSLAQTPPDEFDLRAMQTSTQDLRDQYPFNLDPNSGKPIGLTWTQNTIGNGVRSSASRAYLDSSVRRRPNLDILVNGFATRVMPTKAGGLDIRTVELATTRGGSGRKTLTASKELILSAGAINTAKILLNSGIGNRQELTAHGITPIHNLPDVGKRMDDHGVTIAFWNTASGVPFPEPDPEESLAQWRANKTGPYAESRFSRRHILWTRLPTNSTALTQFGPDPSSGRNAPHIELALSDSGATAGAAVILLTPKSRGSVTLRSSNPFDPPRIELGYLSDPFDLEAFKEGVRIAKRFFSGPAWADYITTTNTPDPDAAPDAWEQFTRNVIGTTHHPSGTAIMSRKGAKNGVVDPDLRVKGTKGLRIADASIIPHIPTGHTQAAVYILAERASDLIKASW